MPARPESLMACIVLSVAVEVNRTFAAALAES